MRDISMWKMNTTSVYSTRIQKRAIAISIHLPPARPLYIRQDAPNLEYAITKMGTINFSNLVAQSAHPTRKKANHPIFEDLFRQPFGPADVIAFDRQYVRIASELLHGAPMPVRAIMETTAFWTALGALTIGGACSLAAYGLYTQGSQSQQDGANANKHIRGLNLSAVVFYSIAGAAAVTWFSTLFWPKNEFEKRFFGIIPFIDPDSWGFNVNFSW